jgi:protein TonB
MPAATAHPVQPKSTPAPPTARRAAAATSAPPPAHDTGVASAEEPNGPEPAERANHLRSAVLSLLAPSLTYPPLARKYGWQGRVLVDVELDADGSLQPLRIAHSSGYRILDHHAFDALKRLGTVPQARPWLGGRPFAFAVPVTYRLIDG